MEIVIVQVSSNFSFQKSSIQWILQILECVWNFTSKVPILLTSVFLMQFQLFIAV